MAVIAASATRSFAGKPGLARESYFSITNQH